MIKKITPLLVSPKTMLALSIGFSLLLVIIHISLQFLRFYGGPQRLLIFTDLFNVDNESSIPTWYSQLILFISAIVAGIIALYKTKASQPYVLQWKVVACILAFLSLDEVATIHEHLIAVLSRSEARAGISMNVWYVFALIMVGTATLILFKFWWKLPGRTKYLLALSAAVYLFGAVYFDSFDGSYVGGTFIHDGPLVGIEEGLEMIGASLFIYTLCDYACREQILLALSFRAPNSQPDSKNHAQI